MNLLVDLKDEIELSSYDPHNPLKVWNKAVIIDMKLYHIIEKSVFSQGIPIILIARGSFRKYPHHENMLIISFWLNQCMVAIA